MTIRDYKILIRKMRTWYKNIGQIFCPAINNLVIFNSKGFNHLLNDGTGKPRTIKERINRLSILKFSITVLEQSTNIEKYRKIYSYKNHKEIEYWKITKEIVPNNVTISVILRRIGKGNITFYSIWKK